MIKRSLLNLLMASLFLLTCCSDLLAQKSEHVVILWDVTGSLLPPPGEKVVDYNKSVLPTFKGGNGLWMDLKKSIVDCVQYVDDDPDNKITIVTFADDIRQIQTECATQDGKAKLVDFVKNYQYKATHCTNIVSPVQKFYSLLDRNRVNYMFLFTDGVNNSPKYTNFSQTLRKWTQKTQGVDAFGFYVLVHKDADIKEIRDAVNSQDNFWIVPDAKVHINIFSVPSTIKYNTRDQKDSLKVTLTGKHNGVKGEVRLLANDQYYDVVCPKTSLNKSCLELQLKQKAGVVPPDKYKLILSPELTGGNNYTFIGPNKITLEVSNLPERNLNLTITDSNFGKASYHDSFLFSKTSNKSIETNIAVDFNKQAVKENSFAKMRVYFVDKKGNKANSSAVGGLKLYVNGTELGDNSFTITPDMTNVTLSISGQQKTKSNKYYGRIELIPTKLDNSTINTSDAIFKWKMSFSHKVNPLKLGLICFFIVLMSILLLWMLVIRYFVYPRFGSVVKTISIPGMAPLIIRFKGVRMVVVSATSQKKQTLWNRFWTGKILYIIHPAFNNPITFIPRRKSVLAKVTAGIYQVQPNPIPGIGSATIVDIQHNVKINVN